MIGVECPPDCTCRGTRRPDSGFLLVEVLVVIALLGLLSAAIAGLLVVTLRAGTIAEERAIRVSSATTAVSIVERSAPADCTNEALVEGDGAGRIAPEVSVVALEVVDGSPPVCLFSVEVDGLVLSGGAEMVEP